MPRPAPDAVDLTLGVDPPEAASLADDLVAEDLPQRELEVAEAGGVNDDVRVDAAAVGELGAGLCEL